MNASYLCPYCEWKLRKNESAGETQYFCKICSNSFQLSDLKAQVAPSRPAEDPRMALERAKQILDENRLARESQLKDFEIVDVKSSGIPKWKFFLSFLGMPIEEESYETPTFPYVSMFFVILCVSIYLFAPHLQERLALDPHHISKYGGLTLLTYSLLHQGFSHLVGNMFFIIPFLDNVEHKMGHSKTFVFILSSAIVSALLHLSFDHSGLPLVGASGVCFAFATYYALSYRNNRFLIMLPLIGFFAYKYRMRLRAWMLIAVYLLLEFMGSFDQMNGLSNVSHFGHLGGALVAFIFYLLDKENL